MRTQKGDSCDVEFTDAEVTGTRLKKRVLDSLCGLHASGSWGASWSLRSLGGLFKGEDWDH